MSTWPQTFQQCTHALSHSRTTTGCSHSIACRALIAHYPAAAPCVPHSRTIRCSLSISYQSHFPWRTKLQYHVYHARSSIQLPDISRGVLYRCPAQLSAYGLYGNYWRVLVTLVQPQTSTRLCSVWLFFVGAGLQNSPPNCPCPMHWAVHGAAAGSRGSRQLALAQRPPHPRARRPAPNQQHRRPTVISV